MTARPYRGVFLTEKGETLPSASVRVTGLWWMSCWRWASPRKPQKAMPRASSIMFRM